MTQTKLPQRLVKALRWTAEVTHNELVLTGKNARVLLDALQIDWLPHVVKEKEREDALQSFKQGVRYKFSSAKIVESMTHHKGREHDHLLVSILCTAVPWPDNALSDLLKTSGLSRYFKYWGGTTTARARDVYFGSKQGRKLQKE